MRTITIAIAACSVSVLTGCDALARFTHAAELDNDGNYCKGNLP